VITIVTAVITAQGESKMTTLITDAAGPAQETGSDKPKAGKKARVAPQRAHQAPSKAKSAPKARAAKKTPKAAKEAGSVRDGSKAAKVLELLKRPEGATMKERLKATGWQAHSVRGFLSGTIQAGPSGS
jgi:hypothetical protein